MFAVSVVGWLAVAGVIGPSLALVAVYIWLFRAVKLRGERTWIWLRVVELLLFPLILFVGVFTTMWLLLAEVVPLGVLPFARRKIGARIQSASTPR
jgi:hypothetical protein